jgi:diaminopimelate decarboxylase
VNRAAPHSPAAPQPHAADLPAALLEEIADAVGTPSYVYDGRAIEAGLARWLAAVPAPDRIWYAAKANSNVLLLARLARGGIGFEVASAGELARVLKAGVPPSRILYGGVPKRPEELHAALDSGLDLVMLQARHEVEQAVEQAASFSPGRARARVGLRVRPGIRAGAHPALETAVRDAKFGLTPDEVPAAWSMLSRAAGLDPVLLGVHLGSGVDPLDPYRRATALLLELARDVERDGEPVRELDLGGGLAIDYQGGADPEPGALAAAVHDAIRESPVRVNGQPLPARFEPGRSIVGRAGILLTRVLYTREEAGRPALVCDAAFSDFARFVLYGAQHRIEPVSAEAAGPRTVDVLGATCESGDVLGTARALHGVARGDLLRVRDVGAYGFTMASNYNARPRPAEILVDGSEVTVIRRREDPADLWRGELAPG